MAAASDVVAGARRILQDYDVDRHTDPDLLKHANGARRALATAQPSTYSKNALLTTVAGSRQTLPADMAVFFEVSRNASGAPVTVAEREFLDTFRPGWRNMAPGPTVHFMYDERDRFVVDLYPPASAGAQVWLSYGQVPADLALTDQLNQAENLFLDPLIDYTVGRTLLEDATSPQNQPRAVLHLQAFAAATGANAAAVLALSPNSANTGGKPPRMATKE